MPVGKIIAVVLWITGILIFISDYSKAKRCTCETTAVVTDVVKENHFRHRSHGSRLETYYCPIIEFTTRDRPCRIKTNFKSTYPETYKIGRQLKIQYNPNNSRDLKLQENTVWEGVIGMGIMFLFGAVMYYISIRTS